MLINYITGNLFDHANNLDKMTFLVHGCNAQGKMGSGVAKEFRAIYPEAYYKYKDDILSLKEHDDPLGRVSWYKENQAFWLGSAIIQKYYGRDGGLYASYEAIETVFKNVQRVAVNYPEVDVIIPRIGAGTAGADWSLVEDIIKRTFSQDTNVTIFVYSK